MLLTLNDKRVESVKDIVGIVAKSNGQFQIFKLEKLPNGWNPIQLVSLRSNRMTPTELRIKCNDWLKTANKDNVQKWLSAIKISKLPKYVRNNYDGIMRRFVVVAKIDNRRVGSTVFAYDENGAIEEGSRQFNVDESLVQLVTK